MIIKRKGASLPLQRQWSNFQLGQRVLGRMLNRDSDGDGVPNRWDCQPNNPFKQEGYKLNKRYRNTPDKSLPPGWDRYTKQHNENVIRKGENKDNVPPWGMLKALKNAREEKEIFEYQQKLAQDAKFREILKIIFGLAFLDRTCVQGPSQKNIGRGMIEKV